MYERVSVCNLPDVMIASAGREQVEREFPFTLIERIHGVSAFPLCVVRLFAHSWAKEKSER
jgi:hypothetical protein